MKLSFLILFCLVLLHTAASAQQDINPIVPDTLAKRLHVKTVTENTFFDSGKTLALSCIERYDTGGGKIEEIDLDNLADTSRNHDQPLMMRLHEFYFYNSNGNLITDSTMTYTMHDTSHLAITYFYNKQGLITAQHNIWYLGKKYTISELATYFYNKYRAIDSITGKGKHITFKYNANNRVIEKKELTNLFRSVIDYTYDSIGRLKRKMEYGIEHDSTSLEEQIALTYNDKGQQLTQEDDKGFVKYETTYLYNNSGLLIKQIQTKRLQNKSKPENNVITYTYTFY